MADKALSTVHRSPRSPVLERETGEREFTQVMEQAFKGRAVPESPQDVYIEHLLECLPPELLNTLSDEQYTMLKRAFLRYHTRHMLDIRGIIPLFFTQFYFVFLFGKDRRQATREVLLERRQATSERASKLFTTTVLTFFLLALLGSTFTLLYLLKSLAGINLIPYFHLRDLF